MKSQAIEILNYHIKMAETWIASDDAGWMKLQLSMHSKVSFVAKCSAQRRENFDLEALHEHHVTEERG